MSEQKYKNCDIRDPLSCFELYDNRGVHFFDRLFVVILIVTFALVIVIGKYFQTVEPKQREQFTRKTEPITAQFILDSPEPEPEPEPEVVEEKKETQIEQKPLEQPKVVEKAEPLPETEHPPQDQPERRVFGLQKVYSSGLGSGGSMRDAVVGRLGNTLNAPVDDTTTATQEDLNVKGEIATVATITANPSIKRMVRPEYTREMIENEVEGVVRVRVLVDIDGKVKDVEVLDDLGHGATEAVVEACKKLEFAPATRDGQPVAVWITIRFNLILT